ncbi:MAG TPA: hypothetical protein VGC79_13330 [Polyangiaceae bacterium]
MKFAGGLAVFISACLPLAVACGPAENSDFFSDRGGSPDPGGAGSANAGRGEGGAEADGGTGSSVGGVAGRLSTGGA